MKRSSSALLLNLKKSRILAEQKTLLHAEADTKEEAEQDSPVYFILPQRSLAEQTKRGEQRNPNKIFIIRRRKASLVASTDFSHINLPRADGDSRPDIEEPRLNAIPPAPWRQPRLVPVS